MFAFLLVMFVLASVCEALEEITYVIAPVMHSSAGILITVAVTAYVTYRWYRARHMEAE